MSNASPVLDPEEQQEKPASGAAWGWVAVALWIGAIFFTSTSLASKWAEAAYQFVTGNLFAYSGASYQPPEMLHLMVDKGFHVTIFCVLAVLLWLAFPAVQRKPLAIVLCGAVVGSCSEFLQRFFPDRDPALRDVLINTAGTTLGVTICFWLSKVGQKRVRATDA